VYIHRHDGAGGMRWDAMGERVCFLSKEHSEVRFGHRKSCVVVNDDDDSIPFES
jgi:hypothetical protein